MTTNKYHGKPCKHGHTLRYKSNGACVQCKKETNSKWRNDNTEYLKEHRNEYLAYGRDWRETNPSHHRDWRVVNPDYQKNWRAANPGYVIHNTKWRENNLEKTKAHQQVTYAIVAGTIQKADNFTCADNGPLCTGQATEYHHESYLPEHWLDVVPLCKFCHKARHSTTLQEI